MKNFFIICLTSISLLSCSSSERLYHYYLLDERESSDIDYNAIQNIDSLTNYHKDTILAVFEPVHGEYKVVRFLSEDYVHCAADYWDNIRKIVVLKIDEKNNVVDGFQSNDFMYESVPLSQTLLRISNHNVKYRKRMKIKHFKFDYWSLDVDTDECECKYDQDLLEDVITQNRTKGIIYRKRK
ncbi:MAG: hypothetical protein MJZ34_08905 [Paludibacteraceae bacterium]|nr:hypothetical protein [Paludibacteraceae bacterium]